MVVVGVEVSISVAVGFTVTVTVFVTGQFAADILETVYVVVINGVAITVAPEVVLRPAAGLHVYVPFPPDAVNVTLLPKHMDAALGVTANTLTPETVDITKSQTSPANPSNIK